MNGLKKRDRRKRVLGRVILQRTVMPVARIVESLCTGYPDGATILVRPQSQPRCGGPTGRRAKRLSRQLEGDEYFD